MTNPRPAGPRVRGVLMDLDGVLYDGERPVPAAGTAVQWLHDHQVPCGFVSNTTSRPRAALAVKLEQHGIPAAVDDLWTPARVAARWLLEQTKIEASAAGGPGDRASRGPQGVALFVPDPTRVEFDGLPLLAADAETGAGYVVLGDLGSAWTFAHLNRAFRLLVSNPAAQLVALGMTRYWKAGDGLRLDAGPFVAALQQATGRVPVVFGKPEASFFREAAGALGLPPAAVAFVGDDIVTDVGPAQQAGLRGVLVRTGKYQPSDLERGIVPHAVIDSIAQLPAWWARQGEP